MKQAEAVAWLIQPQLLRAELVGLVGIFVSINGCVGLFVSACVLVCVRVGACVYACRRACNRIMYTYVKTSVKYVYPSIGVQLCVYGLCQTICASNKCCCQDHTHTHTNTHTHKHTCTQA